MTRSDNPLNKWWRRNLGTVLAILAVVWLLWMWRDSVAGR